MRIAVISELPQFQIGGIESLSYRQIRIWLKLGHEIRVFGKTLPERGRLEIDGALVELRHIYVAEGLGRVGRALSYISSLAALIRQNEGWADVVYCMALGEAAFTAAALKALRLSSLPLVAMPGAAGPRGDVGYIRSVPGYRLVVWLLNRHCDSIVSIAPQIPSDLKGLGLGVPLSHIPVGIPLAPFNERDGIPRSPLRFIAIGRLVEQKGFDLLLQALQRLPEDRHCAINIIGDGPLRSSLEAQSRALGPNIALRWLGALEPEQVQSRLHEADVFVQPSRFEGLSNAALEAMSQGLPILVTRCGGIDRYLDRDSGWAVPVEDVTALTAALEEVLATPGETLQTMGRRCRQLVEDHFDIERTARSHLELFSSLRRGRR